MSLLQSLFLFALFAAAAASAQDGPTDTLVEESLLALPEHLREGTTVAYFDEGNRVVLREGNNGLTCQPDDPETSGFAAWCYPKSHDAYTQRWYELAAQGKESDEVNEIIAAEIESNKLEWPAVAVNYNLRGPSLDTAVLLTVVYVPFSTGESIGVTEERQFNRPWLMLAGTPFA
ncbi:MAG: hypothetical protein ACR2Q3_09130, partial [Woeseiaceae bacterium]